MATRSEVEEQIRGLRNFLRSPQSGEITPQHREFLDKHLYELEDELSNIEFIERQVGFRDKKILRGIGNLALNFIQARIPFLKGAKEKQGIPFGNVVEGEYEVLGEKALPSIESLITPPAGPPVPEGHIPINLPAIETPPPVDFEQLVIGPGALPDNVQNYLQWQDKMIKELPENPTPQQFISNQAEFLDMHTRGLQERLNLNPSQVERIKTSFGDEVGTHWPMFDPSQNTTSTIGTRIAEHIEGMADKLVKQAANVGIASLADERFEAVATNPEEHYDREVFPPYRGEIDPIFLSTSPLRQFLAGRKKGSLDPATVLDELGITLTDKGTGFKNKTTMNWKEYGKDPDNPVKKWGARVQDNRGFNTQAIDSGVANLLRNRMRSGETVTKQELIRVLDRHRGQFSTEITFGGDTSHGNQGFRDLLRMAESKYERGTQSPRKNTDFEIVSKYHPVLEEGGKLGSSPFSLKTGSSHNWASDATGDQHFWLRGEVLEYIDGLKGGSVGEIQSDMGWADSPNKPRYAWLSDIITPESEEITDIQNRQEAVKRAYNDANEEQIGLSQDSSPIVDAVRDLASGNLPKYDVVDSWIEPLGHALSRLEPYFAKKYSALKDEVAEATISGGGMFGKNPLLSDQPFAKEFGIELTKEDVQLPLSELRRIHLNSTTGFDGIEFAENYVKALRPRLLEKYPELDPAEPAFQRGMEDVMQSMMDEYQDIMADSANAFYDLFTDDVGNIAVDTLLKDSPALQNLYEIASTGPTEAELEKLTEYQDQQAGTTALADFPMKQTYPRYGARALIKHALEQGWDTVEIPNLPPGQGGSVENYNKATKELKKIADKFDLPFKPRSAEMPTSTGEEGGGMADRLVTFYRLDIRPLRALIEAEEFEGFIGMKRGGLVTKAQGAGYNINYGDYGRSYN
jgi:hypothetical protein